MNSLVALVLVAVALSINREVALRPQMGFNTWNRFHCEISEELARKTADAMVDLGLDKAGYIYMNLDDCWQISRTKEGKIVEDPRFPSGMKALSDYVHSKNLKFGLYSDAGLYTCAKRPGSLGFEEIDAKTYAEWEVDYLKYDNCHGNGTIPEMRYPPMSRSITKYAPKLLLSMCEWGTSTPAQWARQHSVSWRTTGDIDDSWESMMEIIDINNRYWRNAGPGGWNDPDMLEVGNGGMSTTEYITHFSLWCLVKSPLLIGCDLTNISHDTLRILKNKYAIAVNQDPMGVQGHRVWSDKNGSKEINGIVEAGNSEVWAGPLVDGSFAVLLLNKGKEPKIIRATFTDCGMRKETQADVFDIWEEKPLGRYYETISRIVEPHGVFFMIVTPFVEVPPKPTASVPQGLRE